MAGGITWTLSHSERSSSGLSPLSGSYTQVGSAEQDVNVNLAANTNTQMIAASFNAAGTNSGDLLACILLATQNCTLQTNNNGTPGVQSISTSGTNAGSLVLGYKGQITNSIAYNANAATIQSALVALSTIGANGVAVTSGPWNGNGATAIVTFNTALTALGTIPLITSNISGLTGSGPAITIANNGTTPQDVIPLSANIPLMWDTESGLAVPFSGAVTAFYVTCVNALTFKANIVTY